MLLKGQRIIYSGAHSARGKELPQVVSMRGFNHVLMVDAFPIDETRSETNLNTRPLLLDVWRCPDQGLGVSLAAPRPAIRLDGCSSHRSCGCISRPGRVPA